MIRNFLTRALLVSASIAAALLLCELALRFVPIPGVTYNVSKYDPVTGSGLYPGSTLIYRNERGDAANRRINSIGYPDLDHDREKKPGVFRVGFFGDSYTEARQVALESTYFRLIENRLSDAKLETLAFGVSGNSTLQSYLNFTRWADQFDLDLVVYVFVDNDPGDNVPELMAHASIPYPIIVNGQLEVDNSFRAANAHRQTLTFRLGDYLTSRSMVLSTLSDRIKLLRQYGVMREVSEEDRWMAAGANAAAAGKRPPSSDDSPSTWPEELRERARTITEAVMLQWSQDAEEDSREFAVFYVPRAREMGKAPDEQDSWRSWLETFCKQHDITLLDPSPALLEAESRGEEVFYDHFTENGHSAFADFFVDWYKQSRPQQRRP